VKTSEQLIRQVDALNDAWTSTYRAKKRAIRAYDKRMQKIAKLISKKTNELTERMVDR